MLKIGLTGGVASGKSLASDFFYRCGVPVIDADIIARQLIEPDAPCYKTVVDYFGSSFLNADKTINRAKLRTKIFHDKLAKVQLESILHPQIRKVMLSKADKSESPYILLVIPLLCETATDYDYDIDRILVIETSRHHQAARLCQRDGISTELAKLMIEQQCEPEKRLALADDIIVNKTSRRQLKQEIKSLHRYYLNLAKSC